MTTFTENFEGGTPGTNLTTGNTSFTGFPSGHIPTFDSTVVLSGQSCKNITGNFSYGNWAFPSNVASAYGRVWFKFGAFPTTASAALMVPRLASANWGRLEVDTAGKVRIRNVAATVDTSVTVLSTNVVYRLEYDMTPTTQTARLYDASDILLETLTGPSPTGGVDNMFLGSDATHDGVYYLDAGTLQDSPLTPITSDKWTYAKIVIFG